jgi:hypothetical protein
MNFSKSSSPSPRLLCCLVLTLTFLALGVVPMMADPLSGAIFTTTSAGTTVNGNIYNLSTDVYLNGGPQNTQSAGLTDGVYYFQVTDPSGAVLLSTDPAVCRELTVSGGVVVGSTGPCPHPTGATNPNNGSTTVQLAPFDPTPNNGGEYKVYLIQINEATIGQDGITLSFSDSDAKTDNFKLRTPPCPASNPSCIPLPNPEITGFKWYDANTNGRFDNGEVVIPGWRIDDIFQALTFTTFTDGTGYYTIPVGNGETHTITEILPSSAWKATACIGNTSVNGSPSLQNQPGGANTVCNSTTSASVDTGTANNILGPDFGNVCVGAGGGLTIGYWSNNNGAAEWVGIPYQGTFPITSSSTGPYLVDLKGNFKDFSSNYSAFRTWLLNATATNMAYMLSAQNAGMWENVFGLTTGPNGTRTPASLSELIYTGPVAGNAPSGCTKLTPNAAGFAVLGDVMSASSCAVDKAPVTTKGSSTRSYQEWLKNALDGANNNTTFVQPGPDSCPFTTPY